MLHLPDTVIYSVITAAITATAVFGGAWLNSRAARANAAAALEGVSHQIDYQIAAKLAEFEQARINELRDCMAEMQSYGVTPENDHVRQREFYKFGTRIELLLSRSDPLYEPLQDAMYKFLLAESPAEKFACNPGFVALCQDVLSVKLEILKRKLEDSNQLRRRLDDQVSS